MRSHARPRCWMVLLCSCLVLAAVAPLLLAGEAEPTEPQKAEPKEEKAEPTLEGARQAIASGKYDDGLKALAALLPAAEGEAARDAKVLRIRAYLETGRYAEALAEAAQLESAAPKAPDILTLHAEALLETGRYEEAGKRLAQALEAGRDHVRARLLSLVLAEITGNQDAANAQVSYFFSLYNQDKATTAEALAAVARAVEDEDPHGAWRAYQEAMKADPKYIEAYVLAGFHTASKYAWHFARDNFGKALKINPHLAIAHAGLASVYLANSKYDKALESTEAALKVNPNLVLARQLKAMMLAVEQKNDESLAEIEAALKVRPSDPGTLSLLAAHHEALADAAERDQIIERVLKINPRYADVYTTLSLACERLRRSPSAIAWARKAIELRRDYWHGYYLAGMNLLRSGEEKEGYRLVERAFALNPFNVWACNTLTVLDRDLKKKEFAYHETPHFFVKLDKSEDAILWPYLEPMLEPMWESLTRKYRFEPKGPEQFRGKILVLLYPKHEEFSARTVGLPGLSALGACLGQVITMPSPRIASRRPGGAFNWRQVLIHEFAHVVTLQKTGYRIPRWFTEGISVWEEDDTRVKWDQLLAAGLHEGKLLPLEDLNTGFIRPKFRTQVPLCYYHAFLVTRHVNETYGADALLKMLDAFRDGRQTAKVLPDVTGKTLKQLNEETLAYVRDYASAIRYSPRIGP